ncbi:hypothetical protein E2C01_057022 [Portunus trituberculatus]|uniref:Uncharacterized protein n=1 Tax=Portunus trituberculatus TaxID=210409 RepID=A0A5B7GRX3_PORTR|nr:hypothetical protein [Portunus trituberculatus]
MADADLRFLGSGVAAGHGRPMAVANLTPVNSAKKYQGHCALPYLSKEPRHGSHLMLLGSQLTSVPSQPRDQQHHLVELPLASAYPWLGIVYL